MRSVRVRGLMGNGVVLVSRIVYYLRYPDKSYEITNVHMNRK